MSKINVNTWEPEGSSTDAVMMASSDTVTVPSGAELDIASGATLDVNGTLDVTGATVTGLSAGKVLQVVQTFFTATASTTSATPADVSGFSADITPSATTSNVLITVNVSFGYSGSAVYPYLLLLRDTTSIGLGVGATGVQSNVFLAAGGWEEYSFVLASQTYLDEDISTTSATTYKIQFAQPWASNAAYINRQGNSSNNVYVNFQGSSITLMEIGA
jgi:hypothetical protein